MLSADSAAEAEPGSGGAASNGAGGEAALEGAGSEPDQDEEEEQLPPVGEAVLYVSAEESVEQVRGVASHAIFHGRCLSLVTS